MESSADVARLTQWLARAASGLRFESLTPDAVELVRQCVLDTIGVAIAGAHEPVVEIVLSLAGREAGAADAPIFGRPLRLPARSAALVNGTIAHALDYDDNNLTMPGHVSAVVLPAVLALAEPQRLTGRDLITAFAAGFETGCRLGATMSPGHYARGFHATATHGTLAAAAAAAHALRLDARKTADALSIAATMAAGLKGLFGTPCKPLHAGRAAESGVLAAQLAAAGLATRGDAIECAQGYAATHAPSFDPEAALATPAQGFHLHNNLFKFHAACYGTHGAIECAHRLRRQLGGDVAGIVQIELHTAEGNNTVCNIEEPKDASEARFSLRQVVAMALTGYDTADAEAYGGSALADPQTQRLRRCVRVLLHPIDNIGQASLQASLRDGRTLSVEFDAGAPATDLAEQRERLHRKFDSLVGPVLGAEPARQLRTTLGALEQQSSLIELIPTRLAGQGQP